MKTTIIAGNYLGHITHASLLTIDIIEIIKSYTDITQSYDRKLWTGINKNTIKYTSN